MNTGGFLNDVLRSKRHKANPHEEDVKHHEHKRHLAQHSVDPETVLPRDTESTVPERVLGGGQDQECHEEHGKHGTGAEGPLHKNFNYGRFPTVVLVLEKATETDEDANSCERLSALARCLRCRDSKIDLAVKVSGVSNERVVRQLLHVVHSADVEVTR